MFDPKFFEDISKRISDSMPSGLQQFKEDMEKHCKTILQNTFAKMDLVTREEFDVQTQVLARTRQKLEELEQQLTRMQGGAEEGKRSGDETMDVEGK